MISVAAICAERYGWPYAEIKDGCPLAVILMMIRQPGPWREADPRTITTSDKDLFEWMDANGKEPGDDCSEYYERG